MLEYFLFGCRGIFLKPHTRKIPLKVRHIFSSKKPEISVSGTRRACIYPCARLSCIILRHAVSCLNSTKMRSLKRQTVYTRVTEYSVNYRKPWPLYPGCKQAGVVLDDAMCAGTACCHARGGCRKLCRFAKKSARIFTPRFFMYVSRSLTLDRWF